MINLDKIQESIYNLRKEIVEYDKLIHEEYLSSFIPYGIKRYVNIRVLAYLKKYFNAKDDIDRIKVTTFVIVHNTPKSNNNKNIDTINSYVKMMIVDKFTEILNSANHYTIS